MVRMSKHAAEFVALVTDGQVIDGFGKRCEQVWPAHPDGETVGRKVPEARSGGHEDIANGLGIGPKDVSVNQAGPALSGDISSSARTGT